ncbi:MAG: transcription factor S [Methanosphaera sp.]|nr:transcription factor S [Methanosphaera sp.]
MEFCPDCGKVLLPRKGILHCFSCGYEKQLSRDEKNEYVIQEDVSDKNEVIVTGDKVNTMPTTKGLCYRCKNRELEWWMVQTRKSDEATTIFYRCTKCGNTWRR